MQLCQEYHLAQSTCGGQGFCGKTWHRLHGHLCSSGTYGIDSGTATYQCIFGLGNTPDGHQNSFSPWRSRGRSVYGTTGGHEGTQQRELGMLHAQNTLWANASCTCMEYMSTPCYA